LTAIDRHERRKKGDRFKITIQKEEDGASTADNKKEKGVHLRIEAKKEERKKRRKRVRKAPRMTMILKGKNPDKSWQRRHVEKRPSKKRGEREKESFISKKSSAAQSSPGKK